MTLNFLEKTLNKDSQLILFIGILAIGLFTSCRGVLLPNDYNFMPARTKEANNQFILKKLTPTEIAQHALNPDIAVDKNQSYYLLTGPTQRTGGFTLEILNTNNTLTACVRMPSEKIRVSMAFFTPAVIITTRSKTAPKIEYLGFCS